MANIDTSSPYVSVVMPNHNGAHCIARAIDSFLAEDYDCKELIIVDGKSSDNSHQVIEAYCASFPNLIKWLKVQDSGISDAINLAIDVCRGDVVGYMGSDDLLAGGTFKLISRWAPYVDFDAIFFNSYTYYVKERRCLLQRPPTTDINTSSLLYRGTIVGLQNTYYRKRIFEDIRFNINNKYSMDYEFLLEAASRNAMFFYVDHVATLNYFDGNISHNNQKQTVEAAYVAQRFCGEYAGVLFGEELLPEQDRRGFKVNADVETPIFEKHSEEAKVGAVPVIEVEHRLGYEKSQNLESPQESILTSNEYKSASAVQKTIAAFKEIFVKK